MALKLKMYLFSCSVCVCVCAYHLWVHMYGCLCIWRPENNHKYCSSDSIHLFFVFKQGLSLDWILPSSLIWLASNPQIWNYKGCHIHLILHEGCHPRNFFIIQRQTPCQINYLPRNSVWDFKVTMKWLSTTNKCFDYQIVGKGLDRCCGTMVLYTVTYIVLF